MAEDFPILHKLYKKPQATQLTKNSADFADPYIRKSILGSRIDIDDGACYIVKHQWHKRKAYLAPLFGTGGDYESL